MAEHINKYYKGMNSDSAFTKFNDANYLYAENFKLIYNEASSNYVLQSMVEEIDSIELPVAFDQIQAFTFIRKDLILFTGTGDELYEIHRVDSGQYNDFGITSLTSGYYYDNPATNTLIIKFDTNRPQTPDDTKAVGLYESESIQRVYWTSSDDVVKTINVAIDNSNVSDGDYSNLVPSFPQGTYIDSGNYTVTEGGELKAGKYQYAYSFITDKGSETLPQFFTYNTNIFEANYNLISIGKNIYSSTSVLTGENYKEYEGGQPEEVVNKSIKIDIVLPSGIEEYKSIKVYSLYYGFITGVPDVNIISEHNISSSTTETIVDSGSYVETISYDEFIAKRALYKAKAIAIKDNRLFLANLDEDNFYIPNSDFDARAYRFPVSSSTSVVYDTSSVASTVTYSAPDDFTISGQVIAEDEDLINRSNLLGYEDTVFNLFVPNTTTVGGKGPNIEYNIRYDESSNGKNIGVGANLGSNDTFWKSGYNDSTGLLGVNTFTGYGAPLIRTTNFSTEAYKHHQSREVYRYGIVFYNNLGQSSFVKWIGDIKIPSTNDGSHPGIIREGVITGLTDYSYAIPTYISFNVNLDASFISDYNITAYQIVRVDRDINNSTVTDCGYSAPLAEDGSDYKFKKDLIQDSSYSTIGGFTPYISAVDPATKEPSSTAEKQFMEYISPDVVINPDTDAHQLATQVDFEYFSDFRTSRFKCSTTSAPNTDDNHTVLSKTYTVAPTQPISDSKVDIDEFGIFNDITATTDKILTVGSLTIKNLSTGAYSANGNQQVHGRCGIMKLNTSFEPATEYAGALYTVRRRSLDNSQYGGNSYTARTNNSYVPANEMINVSSGLNNTHIYGDAYITTFEYLRTFVPQEDSTTRDSSNAEVCYFPVESRYNSTLNSGDTYRKRLEVLSIADESILGIKENIGVNYYDLTSSYNQSKPYYDYNPVYSRNDNDRVFFAEPLNFMSNNERDVRITASDKKFYGETIDSFTRFQPNTFIDVDSLYGGINHLITTNKNSLLYFQDSGFGKVSVNEQSMLQDTIGSQIIIGNSELLSRYDYISDKVGCSAYKGICATPKGIYFYNEVDDDVYIYGNSLYNLTRTKSMSKQFRRLLELGGSDARKFVTLTYDYQNKDVIISNNSSYPLIATLVYNEDGELFDTTLPNHTGLYMSNNYVTLHWNNITGQNQYIKVYSSPIRSFIEYRKPRIKLVVNPNNTNINRFDYIEWLTQMISFGVEDFTQTINSIRLSNSYQESDVLELTNPSGSDFKRRFRKWRTNKLRDSASNNPRLKDAYLIIDISFDNDVNTKVILDNLSTFYQSIDIR